MDPYDHELDLSQTEDEARFQSATKARKGEQTYDLTQHNFEKFVMKTTLKVEEFCLDRDNCFSAELTENVTTVHKLITKCYGAVTKAKLITQVEAEWLSGGAIVVNHKTVRRHMSYKILCNLLTEDAMAEMLLHEEEFRVGKGSRHDPILFFTPSYQR